jgi:hypothetical protein
MIILFIILAVILTLIIIYLISRKKTRYPKRDAYYEWLYRERNKPRK